DRLGAGRDDTRLAETILRLHAELQSHARPGQWVDSCLEEMKKEPASVLETAWGKELAGEAMKTARFHAGEMEAALEAMREDETLFRAFSGSYAETAAALNRLSSALERDWDTALGCLPIPFPRAVTPKACRGTELAERCSQTRDACRKDMKKLEERVLSATSESLLRDWRATAPDMTELLSLCMKLENEFQGAKRRANGLDFSDLEHFCLRLLTDERGERTTLARELAEEFEEIMVDEYQDVSRVQDAIFHAISRDGSNLFLVGDVKQAIYRFRLADPGIFREKFSRYGQPENTRGERLIHLQENFRSSREVLEAVNDVFSRVMSAEVGDIDYTREEALLHGGQQQGDYGRPRLLLLARGEGDSADEAESSSADSGPKPEKSASKRRLSSAEAEAELVAGRIQELVRSGVLHDENDNERQIRYGDIAILLRAANTEGKIFAARLAAHGIPADFGAGGSFFSSIEVSMLCSMIMLIDNPHRDIPLLAILRSPAFAFDEDSLSAIRAGSPETDYYTALQCSEDPKAARFLQVLKELRSEAAELDPPQLVSRIMERLNLYALCSAMEDPDTRLGHLTDLQILAAEFQKTGEKGVHRFLRWLLYRQRQAMEPQHGEGNTNSVRILSVHRSKGLEFPVVFYCRLAKPFNVRDTNEAVLLHPTLGIGAKLIDPEEKTEYPTGAHAAIAQKLRRETRSEEMRLLYVAMTRAKEKLYLTACIRKPEEKIEKAGRMTERGPVPAAFAGAATAPVDWLLPTAAVGKALVTEILQDMEEMPEDAEEREEKHPAKSDKWLGFLDSALGFRYPWADAVNIPSKLTATELKMRESFYPDPDAAPLFRTRSSSLRMPDLDAATLTATEAGTLVHLLMQQIDFGKTGSITDIQAEIDRLRQQKFVTTEEAAGIDPEIVRRFFASDTGKRILAAETCRREFRFSLLMDADELLKNAPHEEQILLQGSVDCCFEEESPDGSRELVVVDYKTDHIMGDAAIKKRAEHYRVQLEAYAAALTRITGLRVKEKILYFLNPGVSVSI
ncbi:MAG: UvrD-helicase domain-containing protein, partial [Oscillospiraceae bacterium]|nr:UvrD-helicase domain-containing protein [Oscillospiraceae bacterium]